MAVGTGFTEITDKDAELLTSSPADKLSATACRVAQAVACPHQDFAESIANEALGRTNGLDVDQKKFLSDVDTTQIDHVNLQSTPHAEANTNSTYSTEDQAQTALPPSQISDAAFRAGRHAECINADGADGEIKTAQETEDSPQTGRSAQQGERMPTTDAQVESCQEHEQQLNLAAFLPFSPARVSAGQVNDSGEYSRTLSPQNEALSSRAAICEPIINDPAYLISGEEAISQRGTAMDYVTKNQGDADGGKAFPMKIQHDVAFKSPVGSPVTAATERPHHNTDTNYPISRTENISDSMDLNLVPAATSLALSHAEPAQDVVDVAAKDPDLHHGHRTMESLKYDHLAKPAAASVLPASGELAFSTNNHETSCNGSSPSTMAEPSIAADARESCVAQHASHDVVLGTKTQDMTSKSNHCKQIPAVPLAEQSSEQAVVRREGSVGTEAELTSELPAQSAATTAQSAYRDDAKVETDSSLTSIAPAAQTQSLSTASRASKPVSPRPAIKMTPQEITLAELKAQKSALLASLVSLPAIQVLIEENQTSDVDVSDDGEPTDADAMAAANKLVKEHIKLLHEYNELKDIGQGLMGFIADQRGVRIVEVQDEFGIDTSD